MSDQPHKTLELVTSQSEYTKRIAKNAGISAIGSMIGFVFAPISGLITTRALGVELYGIYSLVTYWTNFLAGLSTLGFGGALTRFISSYRGEKRLDKVKGSIHLSLKVGIIVSSAMTILVFLFPGVICNMLCRQPSMADAFRFFSFNILFTAIYSVLLAALTGFQNQRAVVLSNSILGNAAKIMSLLIFLAFGLKLYAALASSIIQDLVVLCAAVVFLLKVFPELGRRGVKAVSEASKLWKFSGTMFATSLLNRYTIRLDLLFLGFYCSLADVGMYSVALRLQPLIYTPHYAISQIFGPIVAELSLKNNRKEMQYLYRTVTKWTASFSLPIFLTIGLFHQPILELFGNDFKGASAALLILGLGNSFADIFGMSGQVIVMIGKPGLNLVNTICSATVAVGLFTLLIPRYGMIGAAIATAVSVGLINCIRLAQVYKIVGIHPFSTSLAKLVICSLLSGVAIYFAYSGSLLGKFPGAWLIYLVAFWAIYSILWWSNVMENDDRLVIDAIKSKIRNAVR